MFNEHSKDEVRTSLTWDVTVDSRQKKNFPFLAWQKHSSLFEVKRRKKTLKISHVKCF